MVEDVCKAKERVSYVPNVSAAILLKLIVSV